MVVGALECLARWTPDRPVLRGRQPRHPIAKGMDMTKTECGQLDSLLEIAEEEDTPLREADVEFLQSLDGKRERELTAKQTKWFDDLVAKHLLGD